MRALIFLMFLSGTALAGVNPIIVPGPGYVDGSGVVDGNLLMGDDLQLQFGAAPDYWWEYVSGSTLYRLRTSDSDGAGADGTVFSVADGALDGIFGGGLTLGGDLVMGSNNITGQTFYAPTAASDVAAQTLYSQGGHPYSVATVNVDGAHNYLAGGVAVHSLAIVQATASGNTITFNIVEIGDTDETTTVITTDTQYNCTTSDVVCCGEFKTYVDANVDGVTVSCETAEAFIVPDQGTQAVQVTTANGGGTKFVVTEGAAGKSIITEAEFLDSDGFSLLSISGTDTITSLTAPSGSTMNFIVNGTATAMTLDGTDPKVNIWASGIQFGGANGTILDCYAPGDGNCIIKNAAATSGAGLDFSTANNRMYIRPLAFGANTYGALGLGAGYWYTDTQTIPDVQIKTAENEIELGSDWHMVWFDGVLTGGGTAADTGLERVSAAVVGATDGSTGLGAFNASALFAPTAASDVAAQSLYAKAGDSWAQATGGNQAAADFKLSGGIGTRQVTVDDYNNCGTDTVTVTVDGAASVLTEASEWTAATDNATTATSLAAAIDALTGVSSTATAAVVDVVPDAGILMVILAEGDATCTTLTQGANGQLVVAEGTAALPIIGSVNEETSGFYFERVGVGDSRPAISDSGAMVFRFSQDGSISQIYSGASNDMALQAGGGDIIIQGNNLLNFNSSTNIDGNFGGYDGGLAITNNANNAGIVLDARVDGKLGLLNLALTSGVQLDMTSDGRMHVKTRAGATTGQVWAASHYTSDGNTVLDTDELWFSASALARVHSNNSAAGAENLLIYSVTDAAGEYAVVMGTYDDDAGDNGDDSVLLGLATDVAGTEEYKHEFDGDGDSHQITVKGARTGYKFKTESVTFSAAPGDATQVTTGSIIPAGAMVMGVSGRVVTGNTGGCTSMDIGIAAKDTDAFGDSVAVADTTTFTHANGNATADWSAASLGIMPSMAAQEITVTAVGGDGACDDMVVALTVHYVDVTAATTD